MKITVGKMVAIAMSALFLGACASVETSKSDNAAKQQLLTQGIPFYGTDFIKEAKDGNLANVKLFVESGMDVNVTFNGTALDAAVKGKHFDVVQYLIENGANPNDSQVTTDTFGTPLVYAALYDSPEITSYLIDHGASVNLATNTGITPLLAASFQGENEIVKILLSKGAAVNYVQPVTSNTPLIIAVYKKHLDTVKLLVDAGADVNYTTNTGLNSLSYATMNSDFDMYKYLVENGAKIGMGANVLIPLTSNNQAWVKYLVDHGVDPNAKVYDGMPLLIFCAKNNLEKSALALIELGANPNETDQSGNRAIDYAINNTENDLIKKLDPSIDIAKLPSKPVDPNILTQKELLKEFSDSNSYYSAPTEADNSAVKQLETPISVNLNALNKQSTPSDVDLSDINDQTTDQSLDKELDQLNKSLNESLKANDSNLNSISNPTAESTPAVSAPQADQK